MDDLIAFLRARLDEDEQAARAADSPGLHPRGSWERHGDRVEDARGYAVALAQRGSSAHIARWNPARVLAEVEAKRRTVDEHRLASYRASWDEDQDICGTCRYDNGLDVYPYPCPTVRLLALPYTGHPEYREEWRP